MSVTIAIPTALRQFAGGLSEVNVEATTAGEALNLLTASHTELRRHLFNDQNALRNFVNVYLNDEDIRHQKGPDTPVKDGDTIELTAKAREMALVMEASKSGERDTPDYLEVAEGKSAKLLRTPKLADVPYAVQMEPHLIVEFYSR